MIGEKMYTNRIFLIECKGRNDAGQEVLDAPVRFKLSVHQRPGSNDISSNVSDCPYNTGGHGQRCKASHPKGVDKVGEGVVCPYSFDIPYALEKAQREVAGAK